MKNENNKIIKNNKNKKTKQNLNEAVFPKKAPVKAGSDMSGK